MASRKVSAQILPSTAYLLRLKSPPVRAMIDAGVPVALGSDFNPNCPVLSMPTCMNLACVLFRMTMEEALTAATINSAGSIAVAEEVGSIEVGKRGDLLLLGTPVWEQVVYLGMGGLRACPLGSNLS